MTPFQEELYRLIQDLKQEASPFTSSAEDAGSETHKIIKFAQKWDFKEKHDLLSKEKEQMESKFTKEQQMVTDKLTKNLVKELVPIVDEVFILSKFTPEGTPLERGIKLMLTNIERFLKRRDGGIIRPTIGQELDPVRHQAISAEQVPNHHGNTISEIYRYGYYVMGQVVREAEVKVKCGIKNSV
jgi:molecular chaperone GrpE